MKSGAFHPQVYHFKNTKKPPQNFGTLDILVKDDTIVAKRIKRKDGKVPKNQDAQGGYFGILNRSVKPSPWLVAHLGSARCTRGRHLLYTRFEAFHTGFLGFFLPFDKSTRNETVESVAELWQLVRKNCAVYLPGFGA